MEIKYTFKALEDLTYWKKTNNIIILKKIRNLLENIITTPYQGIGKPEPLKYNLSGVWSRRIDKEHRLVYEVENDTVTILSLKGHY